MLIRFFLALVIALLGAHVLATALPSAPPAPEGPPLQVQALCSGGDLVGLSVTASAPGTWRIIFTQQPCSEQPAEKAAAPRTAKPSI